MSQKLLEWRARATEAVDTMPVWFEFCMWHNVFMLHRPCLPNPRPDISSAIACFTATEKLVEVYWTSTRTGFLKFPWHALHNCFEVGMVLLYNIKHRSDIFTSDSTISIPSALDVLNRISVIFCILSERWPSVWQCREFFEAAKNAATKKLFGVLVEQDKDITCPELDILDDIVLHRPGDPMYLKAPDAITEPLPDALIQDDWWDAPMPLQSVDVASAFHFDSSIFEEGFNDLNWAFITSSDLATVAKDFETSTSQKAPPPATERDIQMAQRHDEQNADSYSPDITQNSAANYLDSALTRLPPCTYCRRRRKKCDRLLPSCHQCAKSGQECKFFDSILLHDMPRPYVFALKQKFDDLRAIAGHATKPSQSSSSAGSCNRQLEGSDSTAVSTGSEWFHNGHYASNESRFGATSVFSQLALVALKTGLTLGQISRAAQSSQSSLHLLPSGSFSPSGTSTSPLPLRNVTQDLARQYYYSFELLYPIMNLKEIDDAINVQYGTTDADDTMRSEACVTVHIILAIMTRQLSRREPRFTEWSKALFQHGLSEYNAKVLVFGYPSIRELRLHLLICWYLYLDPAAGNIWRMVGSCSRSVMDLRRSVNATGGGNWEEWAIFISVFRMER